DTVLSLFHARRAAAGQVVRFGSEQRRFNHCRILSQNSPAILNRRFVLTLLDQYLRAGVERGPISWIYLDRGIRSSTRTGLIILEKLFLRLIDKLDRIHVTAPADFHFDRPRYRNLNCQQENKGDKSHVALLACEH